MLSLVAFLLVQGVLTRAPVLPPDTEATANDIGHGRHGNDH